MDNKRVRQAIRIVARTRNDSVVGVDGEHCRRYLKRLARRARRSLDKAFSSQE